jgi:hypothetical protein
MQLPTPGTQNARLYYHLAIGGTITPLSSWLDLGIYRLSARINDLRKLGWPIETERVKVKNKYGEEVRVAEYRMICEDEPWELDSTD